VITIEIVDKEMGFDDVDWFQLAQGGQLAGSSEHGNEPTIFLECEKLFC